MSIVSYQHAIYSEDAMWFTYLAERIGLAVDARENLTFFYR